MKSAEKRQKFQAKLEWLLAVLLSVASVVQMRAQDTSRIVVPARHTWYNYFGNHALNKRWGLHLEGQWRRDGSGERPMQLLLRPGVNFYLTPNVTLTGGYAYVRTHRYGEYPVLAGFPEHRFWQQALLRHSPGRRIALQHRYRLEQRKLGEMRVSPGAAPERIGWRHENRFRYMFRTDIPLSYRNKQPDWYVAAYDEVLVNFGRNVAANVFDQNRAYIALGKATGESARVEFGYMNQLLQQRNGRIFERNHTLMFSLFSTFRILE